MFAWVHVSDSWLWFGLVFIFHVRLMLPHQLLFAAPFALAYGCHKCFIDRKPENCFYFMGVTNLEQKRGQGRKHICQISDYIFHSWSVCITFQWLPFKERKPLMGLFLIYSSEFDMFTVYCQQSFCTWKVKLLISPLWPLCQIARQDRPPPFSQSWHSAASSAGGCPALHTHRGPCLPARESVGLFECQLCVINNDI